MAHRSDARLLVLHGLRLMGPTRARAIADVAGMSELDVERRIARLAVERLAVYRSSRPAGWSLTPAGRVEHADLVRREVDATGARPTIEAAYERFRAVNPAVLEVCSRWQAREVAGHLVRNDHADSSYDTRVVAELVQLHRRVEPLCDDLAGALERYRPYGPQLSHAVRRVQAGDGDWFTKPAIRSYHTVWFELHEDLLTTLGLDRSAEPVP
jgi:hypothetical protein